MTQPKAQEGIQNERSAKTVAYDGLKQDVPGEDASGYSDNSNRILFKRDDEKDN